MTEIHQTLKFGDLPDGTKFHHPKTKEVYKKTFETEYSNAVAEGWQAGPVRTLIHPEAVVMLTDSIDFFTIARDALFSHDGTLWRKISRNRARHGTVTKYFEPSDSVSPL